MRGLVVTISLLFCSAAAHAEVADPANTALRDKPHVVLAQADTPLPVPDAQPSDPQAPAAEDGTGAPAEPGQEDLTEPDPDQPATGDDEGGGTPEDLSLGEIPIIETMELTADIAKRALDSYLMVREKYQESDLDQYEDLQDFVDQNPEGKAFEADIKAAGFATVNDWNLAITTLSFAYASAIDDPTADIQQQIAEIEADTELAQDMKDRMIASLKAMIPSENNKKVMEELMADAAYAEKLKQLDIVEE
jgi:hypothetical protein